MVTEQECIKVSLTNQGTDTEHVWAQDLGPVSVPAGGRKVCIVNIPFFHAKPTWGDVIIVAPAKGDGAYPTWDRAGAEWKSIATRIVEDGGRWMMIVAYQGTGTSADIPALETFGKACSALGIVWEAAPATSRVYLAVPRNLTAEVVMAHLDGLGLSLPLTLVHPVIKRPTRAQTVVGVTPEAPRRPARAKTERGDDSGPIEKQAEKPARTRATTNPPAKPGTMASSSTGMPPAKQPAIARAVTAPVVKATAAKTKAKAKPAPAKKPAAVKAKPAPAKAKAASAKAKPAAKAKAKPKR